MRSSPQNPCGHAGLQSAITVDRRELQIAGSTAPKITGRWPIDRSTSLNARLRTGRRAESSPLTRPIALSYHTQVEFRQLGLPPHPLSGGTSTNVCPAWKSLDGLRRVSRDRSIAKGLRPTRVLASLSLIANCAFSLLQNSSTLSRVSRVRKPVVPSCAFRAADVFGRHACCSPVISIVFRERRKTTLLRDAAPASGGASPSRALSDPEQPAARSDCGKGKIVDTPIRSVYRRPRRR
jgi:hypothetical protein